VYKLQLFSGDDISQNPELGKHETLGVAQAAATAHAKWHFDVGNLKWKNPLVGDVLLPYGDGLVPGFYQILPIGSL
jgi:hypothetical protein